VFHRAGGVDAAVEVARARRGKHFDPAMVDMFCATAGEVLADMDAMAECTALIEAEPGLRRQLTERELDSTLEAMADFTDLRSPYRAGHSRAVAGLAASAAGLCGLPDPEIVTLRRAALIHDVGMHGVPASILDKPRPLTGTETERMRLHSYWTERALARPPTLARIGAIASLACERVDGSGYHRVWRGRPSLPPAGFWPLPNGRGWQYLGLAPVTRRRPRRRCAAAPPCGSRRPPRSTGPRRCRSATAGRRA